MKGATARRRNPRWAARDHIRNLPKGGSGQCDAAQAPAHARLHEAEPPRENTPNTPARIGIPPQDHRAHAQPAKQPPDKFGSWPREKISLRDAQDRKPPGENQPFPAQFLECRPPRAWPGSRHDMPAPGNFRTYDRPKNFPQSAANPVADHGAADPAGSHKANAHGGRIAAGRKAQECSLNETPILSDGCKFGSPAEAGRAGKIPALRLRCAGRSGFQRPWGAAACDPSDADAREFRVRSWFSSARGIRIAACASAWMAGRCAS